MIFNLSKNFAKTNLLFQNIPKQTSLNRNLVYFSFAKLNKQFNQDLSNFENAEQYYQDLQRFTKTSERGILSLKQENFVDLLSLMKNQSDVDTVVNAYYNFIGHRVNLSQKIQDTFIQKVVELEGTDKIQEIIQHHNYLMYFPHPTTTQSVLNFYLQKSDNENTGKVLKSIEQNSLLKVDSSVFSEFLAAEVQKDESAFNYLTVFRICNKRGLALTQEQIGQVILAYSYLFETHNEDFSKLEKYVEKIQNYLNKHNLNHGLFAAVLQALQQNHVEAFQKLEEIVTNKEQINFDNSALFAQFIELTQGKAAQQAIQSYQTLIKYQESSSVLKQQIESLQNNKQQEQEKQQPEEKENEEEQQQNQEQTDKQ